MSAQIIALPVRSKSVPTERELADRLEVVCRKLKMGVQPKPLRKMHPRTHYLLRRIARDMGARITVHGPMEGWTA